MVHLHQYKEERLAKNRQESNTASPARVTLMPDNDLHLVEMGRANPLQNA